MDKLAEALIKLVEQGTPAAYNVAMNYVVISNVTDVITTAVIIGGLVIVATKILAALVRANDQEHERKSAGRD